MCSRAACRRSKRWARPRCCASTRPARSPRTGCGGGARDGGHRVDLATRRGGARSIRAELLAIAAAASELDAFDPMERAIREAASERAAGMAPYAAMTIVREYDLTDGLLAVTHVWAEGQRPPPSRRQGRTRGRRRSVPARARRIAPGSSTASRRWRRTACAYSPSPSGRFHGTGAARIPARVHGCLARTRRPRGPGAAAVPQALAECSRAGIRVVMITGDHPGTALAIARAAGLDYRRRVDRCRHRTTATTRRCASTWRGSTCSRASFPSRSCGWCRRSWRTAKWSP